MGEEGGEKKIQDRAPYAITWWHVAAFSVVQLTSNLIYRFAYPYAPFIAPALGLNLNEYAVFLLAMDLASIGCGFIILAFRSISKYSIAGVHMLQTVTTLLVPMLVPVFAELGISLFGLVALRLLTGVGFFLLGSMQRAIIGHYVEAGHKARFLAVYEMCWNFSSIMLGMFGQLIGQYGALTAFFGLGLLSILSLFIAFPFYPEDMNVRQQEKQQHDVDSKSETGNIPLLASSKHPDSQYGSVNKIEGGSETEDGHKLGDGASCWGSLSGVWHLMQKNAAIVFASRVLVTYYLFNFALTGATSAFNTNFGVWLAKDHGFDEKAVGIATSILGFGEMAGCLLSFGLSDRLGHKNVINTFGVLACSTLVAFSLLENLVGSVLLGLTLLVLYYTLAEWCWITGLSFVSVATPPNVENAITMQLLMSVGSIGSLLGTAAAHPLYRIGGYPLPTAITAVTTMVCLGIFSITTWRLPCSSKEVQSVTVPPP